MRQFTGVHPASSAKGRPSLAPMSFPTREPLPARLTPSSSFYRSFSQSVFFLNNDNGECSNATMCFHSSHLHSFRPRAPASALHPNSAVLLSEPTGSILMCFSPLASVKRLYTCRQEARIRDVPYPKSPRHLHSISQMFPLRENSAIRLYGPAILAALKCYLVALCGGGSKTNGGH